MCGALGEARVLAVLVVIMVMIQREMVASTLLDHDHEEHDGALESSPRRRARMECHLEQRPATPSSWARTFMGAIFDEPKGALRSKRDTGFSS